MEQPPERHLECSSCKKPIVIHYTEIVGKMIYRIGMCQDCPIARQKLHGSGSLQMEGRQSECTNLCCGGCGLTADEVRMGSLLGCPLCYEVFEDILIPELAQINHITQKAGPKKTQHLHLGRLPGQTGEFNPAIKLLALHQALHETLSREDYEQAAWLRDQIQALTDEKNRDEKK